MRRLVLVRHGQSTWNLERRIQGQLGDGLSDVGRQQAEATAAWVTTTYPDATVWSSDLTRCLETAVPIAQRLGGEVTLEVGLRERDFGRWSGRLADDLQYEEHDRFARWAAGSDVVPEVGGESSEELVGRTIGTFDRILATTVADGVAVVVTHGGPVWHGTHAWLGLPFGTLGAVANCAVTELVVAGGERYLDAWNQVAHLPAALRTFRRVVVGTGPPAVGR